MAKKLLCIVLSIVMVLGTFAIAANAAETDYKKMIDDKFFYVTDNKDGTSHPERVAEFIKYWKPEIQEEYYAAKTNEDFEKLYNKMWTQHQFEHDGIHDDVIDEVNDIFNDVGYWYDYRDESYGFLKLNYVCDKEYVLPGEEFTVSLYATSNFNTPILESGMFYDCANIEYVSAVGNDKGVFTDWDHSFVAGWAFYQHRPDLDFRATWWPASLRENQNDSYTKYEAFHDISMYNPLIGHNYTFPVYDNTWVWSATYKVKDDATLGDKINFFAPEDSMPRSDDFIFYMCEGGEIDSALNKTYRCVSATNDTSVDDMVSFDTTLIANTLTLTVGEEGSDAADYTAFDAEVTAFNALDAAEYANYASVKSAIDAAAAALDRDLTSAEQGVVDAATEQVKALAASLVKNEIISVPDVTATLNTQATITAEVAGSPDTLRLVKDGVSYTVARADASITADGLKETWSFKLYVTEPAAVYEVYAVYGEYTDGPVAMTLTGEDGLDLTIHSIVIPDMYPDAKNGGSILAGKHDIIIRTSKDVAKIQFVAGDIDAGYTYTYAPSYVDVVEDGDELVWTIGHNFGPYGEWSMPIRTRAVSTTFAATGDNLVARVLY